MSNLEDGLTQHIASRVRRERASHGWSLAELAKRSGVSKAMISKVERSETSPTAVVLGKLAGAFELTLSALLVEESDPAGRVSRAGQQPTWTDPASGYTRTLLSPGVGAPVEVVKVTLPAGARVPFPAESYGPMQQLIWVTAGRLRFLEGDFEHLLNEGDCLALGPPTDCVFENDTTEAAHYLIILGRRR